MQLSWSSCKIWMIKSAFTQITVDYSLAEQVHATAKLKDVTSVKLWLGADIMLEYELDEAKDVLVCNSPVLTDYHKKMQFCFVPAPTSSLWAIFLL